MSLICVMRFVSNLPCAISCDNLFIGTLRDDGLTSAIPCGEHFFSFHPLPDEGIAIPLSMHIDVCEPASCPEGITLKLLPGSELICDIAFPVIKREIPHIICKYDEGSDSAAIYYDGGVNVCLMREGKVITAFRLCDECQDFSINSFGSYYILCVDEKVIIADKNTLKQTQIIDHCTYHNGMIYKNTPHPDGLRIRQTLDDPSAGIIELSKRDNYPAFTLALSTKCADRSTAMDLLSPSLLKSLTFDDLCEFFGDFYDIEYDFSSPTKLCLSYALHPGIYEIKEFSVELSSGKISNISEV